MVGIRVICVSIRLFDTDMQQGHLPDEVDISFFKLFLEVPRVESLSRQRVYQVIPTPSTRNNIMSRKATY